MVAAVNDLDVPFFVISSSHLLAKEINALQTLSRAINKASVAFIAQFFTQERQLLVAEMSALAPRFPQKGEAYARNTEYPHTLASGEWTAPAAAGAFTEDEVTGYQNLAQEVCENVSRFASAVKPGR